MNNQLPEQKIITGYKPLQDKIAKLVKIRDTLTDPQPSLTILGDTGVGKDLIARIFSVYKDPVLDEVTQLEFVHVNCGSIPESLFEAEMFGASKGGYTGSVSDRKGYIEKANGGTLFLDEVTDLPLKCQGALLTAIESGKFKRVGSTEERSSKFRVVCATNNEKKFLDETQFRMDLRYRVSDFVTKIPPLRVRDGDVSLLAEKFTSGRMPSEVVRDIIRQEHYTSSGKPKAETSVWPGNVRQLERICRAWLSLGTIEREI